MFRSSFVPFLFLDLIIISIFGDIISVAAINAMLQHERTSIYVRVHYVRTYQSVSVMTR